MIHAKIEKDFTFLSALHFEGKFMVNLYEMYAKMEVFTENPAEQHIAIERMIYFLNHQIEDAIFVHEDEKEVIQKYRDAGMKVCTVPEEPFDQIMGMILINKCNAIMEGRIAINEITFGSKLSNLIKFNIEGELAAEEFPEKSWYNSSSLSTQDKVSKKDKIVKLFDQHDWKDLELTWIEK